MRAENEHPDASASGGVSTRAIVFLVACLTAVNMPDEPVAAAEPAAVPQPTLPIVRTRRPLMQHRLAAPALAVLLVLMATPSLAWREPSLWPSMADRRLTPAVHLG